MFFDSIVILFKFIILDVTKSIFYLLFYEKGSMVKLLFCSIFYKTNFNNSYNEQNYLQSGVQPEKKPQ